MSEYKIVFLGDICGKPGREAVCTFLPEIIRQHEPLFTIVNGENSANGVGITPDIADALYAAGADGITLGNHAFNKKDIEPYLDKGKPIIRPWNMPPGVPGKGWAKIKKDGIELAIVNICGRVFLDGYDDPFQAIEYILPELKGCHVFIDFHAEATSEKIAFGYHVDGRATAVVGTHTHVTTADECILTGGTAYITDVGMCGPMNSVLGMDVDVVLKRFRTSMPTRFEVGRGPSVISGVVICVNRDTGRATSINRIRLTE